ncbi:MAG: polysaccharide biosynthesis/export protein [Acidobacteriota bacterium]|jgi:polysaccharide export outer membrane protein|nr:polysaccharide biosynthesis/export protein [Acidobacteriota bacterium]
MKMKHSLKAIALTLALITASTASLFAQATPQQEKEQRGGVLGKIFGQDPKTKKNDQKKDAPSKPSSKAGERLEPDDTNNLPPDVLPEVQAGRRGQLSEEEAAVVPYYNNFLTTYHLGPEDVISISVFGQERYSKAGIVVPPDGRISYYLIPEGISVAGKTTQQLQDELTKRLDEYIIDPKVTVSLDKAVSATYSVIGDVAQPGVRTMTRRYSITEALAMAGGVLETGDESKVIILRQQADGNVHPISVNVKKIKRGQAKEMAFLSPGDQVIVPGNKLKILDKVMKMIPILSFARIFTGGGW